MDERKDKSSPLSPRYRNKKPKDISLVLFPLSHPQTFKNTYTQTFGGDENSWDSNNYCSIYKYACVSISIP